MAKKLLCFAVVSLLVLVVSQRSAVAESALQHDEEQTRPIKLGTSGGNVNDISTSYCCGGTLGALVEDGTAQYILSNNHVLARTNSAPLGERIIQPGLIDQNPLCDQDADDTVAYLSDFIRIRFMEAASVPLNLVDAAIAQVELDAVDANGAILGIGLLSTKTARARPNLVVKKSGRTTGVTTGTISAINVSIDVGYWEECGIGYQVARFNKQFLINTPGFSAGGDSGSLIVENVDSKPRAVGLLFAGNPNVGLTAANPINTVLEALGVNMVGAAAPEPEPPSGTGTIKGTVTSRADGNPIGEASVTVDGGQFATTEPDGSYSIADVPAGNRSVKASAEGFKPQTKRVKLKANEEKTVDFALRVRKEPLGQPHWAGIGRAIRVKNRHEQKIFNVPGVVGTGVGLSKSGQAVIQVYLKEDSAKARAQIPAALENVHVEVLVTGLFEAF